MWKLVFTFLAFLLVSFGQSNAGPCDTIQCKGPLFEMVQLRGVLGDNKKFVDSATKFSPETIMENFNMLPSNVKNYQLLEFVRNNFFEPGFELDTITPEDWIEEPDVLLKQRNPQMLEIATEAHRLWLKLTRQVNMSRLPEDSVSTLIPVKHPFVVPGGRFTEAYYWDSYFTIEGLLASQMPETVKNMINNFIEEINEFGFIPNGFRKYFRNRSQPPFLLHILNSYYDHTSEDKLIFDSLSAFDKEYNFFMKERSVKLNGHHRLNVYRLFADEPRTESFREDYEIARSFGDDEERRNHFFSSITAACESGWDFSSRWLNLPQLSEQNGERDLSTIDTISLIPVDLNALMYYNERTLQKFNCKYARGSQARSEFLTKCFWYGRQARQRFRLMEKVLFNEKGWSDRNLTSGKNRNEQKVKVNYFGQLDLNGEREITPLYVSDLSPLYFMDDEWRTNDVRRHESENIAKQEKEISEKIKKLNNMVMDKLIAGVDDILDSLENGGDMETVTMNEWQELLLKHPNGVPISNINTGEQWDLPNGWSPYQFLLIKTLIRFHEENFGQNPTYKRLALHLATKWLQTNYCAYKANGGFYEKYSVSGPKGELGGGGEYKVVEGFGWTNGVILYLADKLPEIDLDSKCHSD